MTNNFKDELKIIIKAGIMCREMPHYQEVINEISALHDKEIAELKAENERLAREVSGWKMSAEADRGR